MQWAKWAIRWSGELFDWLRLLVSHRPVWVVGFWVLLAASVFLFAPDLSRLAAEGQANLLPRNSESGIGAELVKKYWPDQWYDSQLALALYRPGGLTEADHQYAARLADRFEAKDRPHNILRVLGPRSIREIASRLISRDRTMQLVVVPLSTSFVAPSSQDAVEWLQKQADPKVSGIAPPAGLQVLWSGDAEIGRDYMHEVQVSLDRAALATVVLLLLVLMAVYRSLWLAAVPLLSIGICLVISRGVLAWMAQAGWAISPLVELFLIVLLFGSGTDFCLFLSWRFGEHWNAANPGGAMRATMKYTIHPLLTSAGTVFIGLTLMGTTQFKLFSSTGPSVAIGLLITLVAVLSLTPALLVMLAHYRPKSFAGLTAPPSGFWNDIGHRVLGKPLLTWLATLALMLPLAVLGCLTVYIQDTLSEMPGATASVRNLKLIAEKFGPGFVAPLTLVLESEQSFRDSQGLALIDDVSRILSHQRRLVEVRSATQPMGSTEPLDPARLAARLGEVDSGFDRMVAGARQLQNGLNQGAAKLRTALLFENLTGVKLTGPAAAPARPANGPTPAPPGAQPPHPSQSLLGGLRDASSALFGPSRTPAKDVEKPVPEPPPPPADPREQMLKELTMAADGAGQIADGALRAQREIASILADPVGRRALDRLLITPSTVKEHPELLRSFAAYLSPDGHAARIDLVQANRIFSAAAMDQVGVLRHRTHDYLSEAEWLPTSAHFTGPNAESADIWALTRRDQKQTWIIVPLGVFLILLFALHDFWACVNLVITMVLTYAFALGATHLVFVTLLGAQGLDWKVPYFLFVLLVAVGVDYNVFLMTRLHEEANALGLRAGITRAIAQTGGLISSAAAITASSFASFLFSPLSSIRQLGFALVIGITIDAVLVRPVLVPCGHWLMNRHKERKRVLPVPTAPLGRLAHVAD